MLLRNTILCALSLLLFSASAARAQDAFAGADNGPGPVGRTPGAPRVLGFEDLQKVAPLITKMDAALSAGKLDEFALNAYKLYSITGVEAYRQFGDVATGDEDARNFAGIDMLEHVDMVKKIMKGRGKSDSQIFSFVQNLRHETGDETKSNEVAQMQSDAVSDGNTELCGLRKLSTTDLRVYIEEPYGHHERTLRNCIQRSLAEICAATHGALKLRFVRESEANMCITYNRREVLWSTYKNDCTSVITEPNMGDTFDHVRLQMPTRATIHRSIIESEAQEYCLRELPCALGLSWHPVSRERFVYDFRDIVKGRKNSSAGSRASTTGLPGAARLEALVQNALSDGIDHAFDFHAGLAYLERGDTAMARRYFTNASPYLILYPADMHTAISKLINSGDTAGAELVAMACINDDPNNDENSAATREYNRVMKVRATESVSSTPAKDLPKLGKTEASLLAKLYEPAPVVSSKQF